MQRKTVLLLILILLIGGISACTSQQTADPEENRDEQVTFAVETVYAQIAMTQAAAEAMATSTPIPTNTPEPTQTPTIAVPTETPTNVFVAQATETTNAATQPQQPQQPSQPQDTGMPCHRANLEYETIPDNSELAPEQQFVKVWRIKNTGSCTWNNNYTLRFYSGDLLNAGASIVLTEDDIPTWGYANVEVDMKAPATLGTYQGYWKLISDGGKIFGVGPDGKGWIWVKIIVVEK